MAAKTSAGILPYRHAGEVLQFFLIHPGGPYWARQDVGAWSIPKGSVESDNYLVEALREFREETGFDAQGEFIKLSPQKLKSGKTIYAWAVKLDLDADNLRSNVVTIEWPPKSGKTMSFPEADRGAWFDDVAALAKINQGQRGFINELKFLLTTAECTS